MEVSETLRVSERVKNTFGVLNERRKPFDKMRGVAELFDNLNKKDEDKIYWVCSHYSKKIEASINPVIMTLKQFKDERKTKFIDEINKSRIEIYGHLS